MAFANSAITDIIATTIQSRSGVLADNLTQNNAILQRLNAKGNVQPFSGGNVILQEIMYNDTTTNNANSYSGYEVLNITPDSPISAAQFSITQYADSKLGHLINAEMGVFQIVAQNSTEGYSWGGAFNTDSKRKTATITVKLEYETN